MKLLRAMSIEEAVKFLSKDELFSDAKHARAVKRNKTNSVGFCFANGENIYETMQHLVGVVNDDIVLVGTLKEKPVHKFTHGWGVYATHKEIPKDIGSTITSTLEMLAELVANDEEAKKSQQKLDEWSTLAYSQDDFESWELFVRQKPSKEIMLKMGYNDFQQDIAKDLGSTQWLDPKKVGASK